MTYDKPVILSLSSLRDGTLQKAVASHVTDAMPIRPLLIRINNSIRFELFGELTAPNVVNGAKGQLIERSCLDKYCARTDGMRAKLVATILPKLKDIHRALESDRPTARPNSPKKTAPVVAGAVLELVKSLRKPI